MKIKVDLHNHLGTFEFGKSKRLFNRTIQRTKQTLGEEGILGIANAQDQGEGRYETFLASKTCDVVEYLDGFYIPEHQLYVMRNQELFTRDKQNRSSGHILAIGLEKGVFLEDHKPLDYSFEQAKGHGACVVPVHTCFADGIISQNYPEVIQAISQVIKGEAELSDILKSIPDKLHEYLAQYVSALEVDSSCLWLPHPSYYSASKKGKLLYEAVKTKYDKIGALTSTDGHSWREVGACRTELEKPNFEGSFSLAGPLDKVIREHRDYSQDQQKTDVFGTLNHIGTLIGGTCLQKLKFWSK